MVRGEEFSLGVTGLLDELLEKEAAQGRVVESSDSKPSESEIRGIFQRTEALCEEARAFFNLMSKADEIDAKAEAELQEKAGTCNELGGTCMTFGGTGMFFGTVDSLSEALEANKEIVDKLIDDILEEMQRTGRIRPGESPPEAGTPMFETGTQVSNAELSDLDLDKLLADCEALREETVRCRGLQGTLRLDDFNKSINL